MTQVNRLIGLFLCLWLVGCAAPAPAGRLGHYVLYAGEVPAVDQPLPLDRPIRVALVLIPDSGARMPHHPCPMKRFERLLMS
ncbi:MAG: hypothetical protein U0231_00170 [Nitrospiraceae bacterium]